MNQREIVVEPLTVGKPRSWYRVSSLIAMLAGLLTTLLVYLLQAPLFEDLHNYPFTLFVFLWIFGVMLACAFSVVRHADAVARRLGEPYGTLVLTISVIIIEVSLIAAIILHGENNPTLARDAMFATLMIVLNGMVGTALLMGALRYWEQEYNLEGARSFLVVIASLAVFALIMPNLTKTEPDPSLSPFQAGLFGAITILFYAIFLAIQTMRHRSFFAEPVNGKGEAVAYLVARQTRPPGPLWYHVLMLLMTLAPIVALSTFLAVIVDFGIEHLGAPAPLGGILVAILVLSPEGLTAFHAALANQLQRAVNVCLGSALATIGLTIPAVLAIGLWTGYEVHLGLDRVDAALLVLTLFVSALTFGGARTNVLQGTVHLLLFVVYVALIFSP
jgi:Ca2+:H+ antiporter